MVVRLLKSILLFVVACLAAVAGAQMTSHAHWSASLDPADTRAGEVGCVVMHVKVDAGWHVYALRNTAQATPTSFAIPAGSLTAAGDPQQQTPETKFDSNFKVDTSFFEGEADFRLPVRIKAGTSGSQSGKVTVTYQTCSSTQCSIPATEDISVSFSVAPGAARTDRTQPIASVAPPSPAPTGAPADEFTAKIKQAKDQGLLSFLWLAFTLGLTALLTPCVFPMIPITVSYFTKGRQEGGKTNYGGATAYCLGLMGTFTGLGLVMTALFGATGISQLATNAWVNLALAVLFIVLAASLMGVFELRLPSGMVNKFGNKSRQGGWVGPVFMGLTFSLTSFTCTVPFVGTILATAAKEGYFYPAMGMLAFSLAFALPFFLLALFPQFLAKLPKSGGWLSTVKVFMGFLEIAAALKFLSNADLVWQAGLITRAVFLSIWATIAIIGACYLLGALKLPHDMGESKIGWLRRAFGVATLGAAVFCLMGLQGRPLGQVSAFLPPDPYPGSKSQGNDLYKWADSYEAAVTQAAAEHKNIFIDFTGVTCTNCRYMEENVFPLPSVRQRFEKLVLAKLFTDRPIPGDRANVALEGKLAQDNTLPCYVIVTPEGRVLKVQQGIAEEKEFNAVLDTGLAMQVSKR